MWLGNGTPTILLYNLTGVGPNEDSIALSYSQISRSARCSPSLGWFCILMDSLSFSTAIRPFASVETLCSFISQSSPTIHLTRRVRCRHQPGVSRLGHIVYLTNSNIERNLTPVDGQYLRTVSTSSMSRGTSYYQADTSGTKFFSSVANSKIR